METESGIQAGAELWEAVKVALETSVSPYMYKDVFPGAVLAGWEAGTITIALRDERVCEIAAGRLQSSVERAIGAAIGEPVEVRFVPKQLRLMDEGFALVEVPGVARPVGHSEGVERIALADRRQVRWYRVDNVVIDEYVRLMGARTYAVYSLYCRMAGRDGLSWPGYDYICEVLGIGRSTLAEANRVLEVLGLVEVVRGDSMRSNRYYLRDVVELTEERLGRILEEAEVLGLDKLVTAIGGRPGASGDLPASAGSGRGASTGSARGSSPHNTGGEADHGPVTGGGPPASASSVRGASASFDGAQDAFGSGKEEQTSVTSPEASASVAEASEPVDKGSPRTGPRGPVAGPGQSQVGTGVVLSEDWGSPRTGPEQDKQNKTNVTRPMKKGGPAPQRVREPPSAGELVKLLREVGVTKTVARKLVGRYGHEPERIVAWVEYTLDQTSIKSLPAFVVSRVQGGSWPPGHRPDG